MVMELFNCRFFVVFVDVGDGGLFFFLFVLYVCVLFCFCLCCLICCDRLCCICGGGGFCCGGFLYMWFRFLVVGVC